MCSQREELTRANGKITLFGNNFITRLCAEVSEYDNLGEAYPSAQSS